MPTKCKKIPVRKPSETHCEPLEQLPNEYRDAIALMITFSLITGLVCVVMHFVEVEAVFHMIAGMFAPPLHLIVRRFLLKLF